MFGVLTVLIGIPDLLETQTKGVTMTHIRSGIVVKLGGRLSFCSREVCGLIKQEQRGSKPFVGEIGKDVLVGHIPRVLIVSTSQDGVLISVRKVLIPIDSKLAIYIPLVVPIIELQGDFGLLLTIKDLLQKAVGVVLSTVSEVFSRKHGVCVPIGGLLNDSQNSIIGIGITILRLIGVVRTSVRVIGIVGVCVILLLVPIRQIGLKLLETDSKDLSIST